MQDTLTETMRHCIWAILITSFLIALQTRILPYITLKYLYISMPFHLNLLSILCGAVQWWIPALMVIGISTVCLKIKRPDFFDSFLLKMPCLRLVTIPPYSFRYFWTKALTKDEALAMDAVENQEFSFESDNVLRRIKETYPLIHAAVLKREEMTADDAAETAIYAQKVFIDACYDFRELVSYSCIGLLIVFTLSLITLYLD